MSNGLAEVLGLLTPYDVTGCRKMRVGAEHDGGYVLLDMIGPSQPILSYGISDEVSFDFSMAERGNEIFMFDFSVDGPPISHPRFRFRKEGVAGTTKGDGVFFSVEDHLARLGIVSDAMILKMDVEGAEWDVFNAMPPDVLNRFEQIVLELHGLDELVDADWQLRMGTALRRLNKTFRLFHVHANNCTPLQVCNGFPVVPALEVSYVRADLVKAHRSTTLFPTSLDTPNNPNAADIPLWFYPFAPEGAANRLLFTDAAPRVTLPRLAEPKLAASTRYALGGEGAAVLESGLLSGWDEPERECVWTTNVDAELFYMVDDIGAESADVELAFRPIPHLDRNIRISVSANGTPCGDWQLGAEDFDQPQARRMLRKVPLRQVGTRRCMQIMLHIPGVRSAVELGINDRDHRRLGIGLQAVTVFPST